MKINPLSAGFRRTIQVVSAALMNGYVLGFVKGKVWSGPSKAFCIPALNCWSCPGALAGCPIGALQNTIGAERKFPFYALGFLLLMGALFGRFVCGFLCPFGFIQDLLAKIPLPRPVLRGAALGADRALRYLKYGVLALFVVALPLFLAPGGVAPPYFCEYICPAGTLEGGIPLLAANASLRGQADALFMWKVCVLAGIIIAALFIPRAFCRYLCPLGAFYAFFNKVALFRLYYDKAACIRCMRCVKSCPMGVDVLKDINSPECVRCGQCSRVCPAGAIRTCGARGGCANAADACGE